MKRTDDRMRTINGISKRPLLAGGRRLHCRWQKMNFRIPTARSPHETLLFAKAPDFFAAVRQRVLRKNRVNRCSSWIFSNSLSQVVLSRTASQSR